MKLFLPLLFLLFTTFCSAQKYALLDKKLAQPVTYTNTVTLQNDFDGLFAVEKDHLKEFINEVEKILKEISGKPPVTEAFNFSIGSTKFVGLQIPLAEENRLDVVIVTHCGNTKTTMHLCDAKLTNANNMYIISTWLKYIKSYVK